MECPVCRVELTMSERQGIEIDYCPKCRGVWLDRGELDKIIERTNSEMLQKQPSKSESYHQGRHYDHDHDEKHGKSHYYKKKSFLLDLFD